MISVTSAFLLIALVFHKSVTECLLLAADLDYRTSLGPMKHLMHPYQLYQPLNKSHLMPDGCRLNYCVVLKCGKSFFIAFQKIWNYPHTQSGLWSLGQHIHLRIQLPMHSVWI